jgi:predicted Zn-dependent protease
MTQMSRNDMGAAVATLRNYRRQYPAEKLVFPSLTCEAEALLQLGDSKTAASALQEANVAENPEQLRVQWMLTRLTPAAAADPSTPEPAATPEPTTPAEPAAPAEPAPQPEPAAEPKPSAESPK